MILKIYSQSHSLGGKKSKIHKNGKNIKKNYNKQIVEISETLSHDKTWSTGEGNGKPRQYSCLENTRNCMKRQKDRTLKDELPRSLGAQYAAGED